VADTECEGDAINGEVHGAIADDDFLVVFAMKGVGHARFIGGIRDTAIPKDRKFTWDDVNTRTFNLLKLRVEKVNWFSTYRVHHRVATKFRDRRVFLLGDSAHVHSPVGGQGMNTGIGDAINLAWKLEEVIHGRSSATLLDTYEPERMAFAQKLVATTDRAFTLVTSSGFWARRIRPLAPYVVGVLSRLKSVRRLLFSTISQIAIDYRFGAISQGKYGRVQAGDRLPWMQIGDSDNHAPLQSRAWQVHVYGKPSVNLAQICIEKGLSLHEFAWHREMKKAGILDSAVFVVRPDGHIGLAAQGECNQIVGEYVDRIAFSADSSRF
ncbi:MAG: FAD-dependent monooxygenase, partial [Chlorobia bacterium]|nr:FAD-dependent monooxygenase [Fimbriimonadaceae bacterium]